MTGPIACFINILVWTLIVAVVIWLGKEALAALGIGVPAHIQRLVSIILGLILVLMLIDCLFVGGGFAPHWPMRHG